MGISLQENQRKPTELLMEFFRRKFLQTEIIPSPNLSVFTNKYKLSVIRSVYTDDVCHRYVPTVSPTDDTVFLESCNGVMTWIFSDDFIDGITEGFKPG
jgi:hypothetical protein